MRGVPLLIFILLIAGAGIYFFSGDSSDAPGGVLVTSFESCVDAGNPVMESFPRQCAHNGVTYVEEVDTPIRESNGSVLCEESDRDAFCTQQYDPVCGLTQIECFTEPCDPVPETYGNACTACSNTRVISYTEGMCNTL